MEVVVGKAAATETEVVVGKAALATGMEVAVGTSGAGDWHVGRDGSIGVLSRYKRRKNRNRKIYKKSPYLEICLPL
jgi:hypothetical protein